MTVHLGKNPVGVGRIVEKKVPKEKFGATVDNFLGDVDADGNYVAPSEPVEINLAGVKSVPAYGFAYKFYGINNLVLTANEVVTVGQCAFKNAFELSSPNTHSLVCSFENLEVINANEVFSSACSKRGDTSKPFIVFNKLKKVSGNDVFNSFAVATKPRFDQIFPSLEEISGSKVFYSAFQMTANVIVTLSKVKKITGSKSSYDATFGYLYYQNTVWNFPSATEFTGYIWNASASYAGEIHFAAANQAAIEACDGYANKWGFAGATIYFDL